MNEKVKKSGRKEEAIIVVSILIPIIGFGYAIYYLIKQKYCQARDYFFYGLLGIGILVLFHFLNKGSNSPNLSLGMLAGILIYVLIYVLVDDDVDIKRVGLGALISSILYIAISSFRNERLINLLISIPEIFVFILVYLFFKKMIKPWIAFVLALIISLVWVLGLFFITGILFNI